MGQCVLFRESIAPVFYVVLLHCVKVVLKLGSTSMNEKKVFYWFVLVVVKVSLCLDNKLCFCNIDKFIRLLVS